MISTVVLYTFMGLAIPTALMTVKTKRKTGWHGERLQCNGCDSMPPVFRFPKTVNEVLGGGWTCRECGTRNEVGLYGETD